jgi:hypothetical protein
MSIFNIIPENFFVPLGSKNRAIYADCIFIIFQSLKNSLSFGLEKEILIQNLTCYFEDHIEEELIFSEENEEVSDSREKANLIIRKLRDYGWLEVETDNNYVQRVNFNDYSVKIIEALDKIINNEKLEYQGYVFNIYSNLYNEESYSQPYILLRNVLNSTEGLINGLKILNSNIKKYMDRLTRDLTVKEIMEQFSDYRSEVGDKAYHRLKTSDNVSRFRPKIIERLEELETDESFIRRVALELKDVEELKDDEKSRERVYEIINIVINAFREMDHITQEIDRKNTNYMKSAISRARFLMSSNNDVEGNIHSILKEIVSTIEDESDLKDEVDDNISTIFSIYSQGFIDETSLYTPTVNRRTFNTEKIDEASINKDAIEEKKMLLIEKNKHRFSRENVNTFVLNCLGDKTVIRGSTLPLETPRDFIRLIFIRLYGKSKLSPYEIKNKKDLTEKNGFSFEDFEIWRKS